MGGGGDSQRILGLNTTTVMVVLLLGLWLLLGCDYNDVYDTNKSKITYLLCELYYRQINQPTKFVNYKAAITPACISQK